MTALTEADLDVLAEAGAGWCNEETFAALIALARRARRMEGALRTCAGLANELTWKPATWPYADRLQRIISDAILSEPGA